MITIEITNGSPIGPVYHVTNNVIIGSDRNLYGKEVYYVFFQGTANKFLISKETFDEIAQGLKDNKTYFTITKLV